MTTPLDTWEYRTTILHTVPARIEMATGERLPISVDFGPWVAQSPEGERVITGILPALRDVTTDADFATGILQSPTADENNIVQVWLGNLIDTHSYELSIRVTVGTTPPTRVWVSRTLIDVV